MLAERLVAEARLRLRLRLRMRVLLVLLLAEDLQLQEELLLLQQTRIRRVHLRRRRSLGLLVRRDVLVVLQLLHFRLDIFGFLVAVLLRHFGLLCTVKEQRIRVADFRVSASHHSNIICV